MSRRASQCDRILEVLRDGRWHSTGEIVQAVPCIVHSRVSNLREKGFVVEHRQAGSGAAGSLYRLVGAALEEAGCDGPGYPVSSSVAARSLPPADGAAIGSAGEDVSSGVSSPTDLSAAAPPVGPFGVAASEGDVVRLLHAHGLEEYVEPEPLFDLEAGI